jgi:hypothetical protein
MQRDCCRVIVAPSAGDRERVRDLDDVAIRVLGYMLRHCRFLLLPAQSRAASISSTLAPGTALITSRIAR